MTKDNTKGNQEKDKNKPVDSEKQDSIKEPSDDYVFRLERAFPNPAEVFLPYRVGNTKDCDAIIVLDTNILLLPYSFKTGDLRRLEQTYSTLKAQNRLYIAGRVAREFISRRDEQLANLVQTLLDDRSRVQTSFNLLPSQLQSVPGHEQLLQIVEDFKKISERYKKTVEKIRSAIVSWRGNDPITCMYQKLFDPGNIIENPDGEKILAAEWAKRLRGRIPPGYKDGTKPDTGIGDFLIWKSILKIGNDSKKDLIFLTGDEKADWMVRSGRNGLFPRPELVSEYRNCSGGKSLRLSSLAQLLEEMNGLDDFVEDVKVAETAANAAIRTSTLETTYLATSSQTIVVDPSWDDGIVQVDYHHDIFSFRIILLPSGVTYLTKWGSHSEATKTKKAAPGQVITDSMIEHSFGTSEIDRDDVFFVKNNTSNIFIGRILEKVLYKEVDELKCRVSISYRIVPRNSLIIIP